VLKQRRNSETVADCLSRIKSAAGGSANLMPLVVEAVENYCTLGEISDELRSVFGEYR
jgi:methylmalonyl-CoA mutase N-terminal domain/subunit